MSYQQTRSLQDPGFYPRPTSPLIDLSNLTIPTISFTSQVGKPPTYVEENQSTTFTFTGANQYLFKVYTPATPTERACIEINLAAVGTSGAIIGQVASQTGSSAVTTAVGVPLSGFMPVQSSASNLAGYMISSITQAGSIHYTMACTSAGTAAISTTTRVTRTAV